MTTVLVSPTDGELREELGDTAIISSIPEERGCDVVVFLPSLSIGVQRKSVPHDFYLSIKDGRLAKELPLMRERTTIPILILENEPGFDSRGLLRSSDHRHPYPVTEEGYKKLILSVKYTQGVDVDATSSIEDTAKRIKWYIQYFSKGKHKSLFSRSPLVAQWGIESRKERALYLLQGFPGVGPSLAENIWDHFQTVPLKWCCSKEELGEVPLVGKSRLEKLWSVLQRE